MTVLQPPSVSAMREAGIPARFFKLSENPFPHYPKALGWWDRRAEFASKGQGLYGQGAAVLPAMVELMKRMLGEQSRPRTLSGNTDPCQYLEAAELYAGNTFQITDLQRAVFEVPYLILANVGRQTNNRIYTVINYTLIRRFQNGVVTFLHLLPDSECKDALELIVQELPEGMLAPV